MGSLDILNQGEIVAQHTGVSVSQEDFDIRHEGEYGKGFVATDGEGEVIDRIVGEFSMATGEDFICIRGIWVNAFGPDEEFPEGGVYYGILDESGDFKPREELEGDENRLLEREWRLRPQDMDGAELLASGRAAGYGGSDPD